MISVLTLTYQRHHILEEAIHSFLLQNEPDSEMIVVNDSPDTFYNFSHPQVKIFNLDKRFSSISKKLEWGFKNCSFDFIYRLDDDDLLAPEGLKMSKDIIKNNPGYEIYRPKSFYYFENNTFISIENNLNSGNIYTKKYIERIQFGDKSWGEDYDITLGFNAKIFEDETVKTMIYRWGMGTYHVSGLGNVTTEEMYKTIDSMTKNNRGNIILNPRFGSDYYKMINYI
jgi:glycosyltransferase involved in cell wall biosynthesis